MKLELINFKCYDEKIINFKTGKGVILISAPSGSGKSTILQAIIFALFGTGTKVISVGKTSCKVEFEFENLIITRTKGPNRLVLRKNNIEYEGDVAQNIINDYFGVNFTTISYISQNSNNSFITMSPADKLEFLEKIAFKNTDILGIKSKIKKLINDRNLDLNNTTSQMEIVEETVKDLEVPDHIDFPIKCKNGSIPKSSKNMELLIKNENVRLKNAKVLLKKSRNLFEEKQKELTDLKILNTYIDTKNENQLDMKMKELNIKEDEIAVLYNGDENLNDLEQRLKILLLNKELISVLEKIDDYNKKLKEIETSELLELTKELENISKELWIEYAKDDAKETIKDTKELLNDVTKINELTKSLHNEEEYSEKLKKYKNKLEDNLEELKNETSRYEELKKMKEVYVCPVCDNKLFLKNNKLIESSCESNLELKDGIDNDIKILEKRIPELKKEIKNIEMNILKIENILTTNISTYKMIDEIKNKYEEIPDEESVIEDLEYIKNYYNSQTILENKKSKIETKLLKKEFSILHQNFKKDIEKLEAKKEQIQNTYTTDNNIEIDIFSEDELRNMISVEKHNKNILDDLNASKKNIENEILEQERKISELRKKHLEVHVELRNVNDVLETINTVQKEITDLENIQRQCENNFSKIEKYEKFIEEKNKHDSWVEKMSFLKTKEVNEKNKYHSSILLKEKISEAENIFIIHVIDQINNYAKLYLDLFFEEPISIVLSAFKQIKKNIKPTLNVEILYKSIESDLTMLSGGELARVNLAFTLALCDIFNSQLVMLDESTANLDQDTTNLIFSSIKENCKFKICIVVAHNITEGIFDEIIDCRY
jgi:exonuclease SbcC